MRPQQELSRSPAVSGIHVNPAGGVPKHPVASAKLTPEGVVGDLQRDRVHHGGPQRAVCLYSAERIADLQAEGHPIAPGTTGENLTLAGLDWATLGSGDRLRVGVVDLEISSLAPPCKTIAASFRDGAFTRISETIAPGWSRLYARVLTAGVVHLGDPVTLLPTPK